MVEHAITLWGLEVVQRVFTEPNPVEPTWSLVQRVIVVTALGDHIALARWALTLPWVDFVTVVRLVAGRYRSGGIDDE